MATELATAYVTLVPSFKGLESNLSNAINGANLDSVGSSIGNKLTSSIGDAFQKVGTIATGVIGSIGGAIGSLAATGGMARALNLEQAQTMFKGLKLDWNDYYGTIDQAVTGTAYSLDAAALVAANLAASGVAAGDQMSTALNACVGTAATFGSNLGEIGNIFQKVSAKGKVSGDELLQLSERGINATSVLAEYLGKTQAEVREMVTAGKIDFETFSNAMYAAFGDSAKAANETFTGSMANMQTALSRIGEKFATPFKNACIPVFNALREAINAVGSTLTPVIEKFSSFAQTISENLVSKIKTFADALTNGASIFDAFKAALGQAGAVVATVITAIGGLGAAFGVLSTALSVVPGLSTLVGALSGGAASAGIFSASMKLVGSAVNGVKGYIGTFNNSMMVAMGTMDAAGVKTTLLGTAFGKFRLAVANAGGGIRGFAAVIGAALTSPVGIAIGVIGALAAAVIYLWNTNEQFRTQMIAIGQELMASLQPSLELIGQSLMNLASAVLPLITSLIQMLVPLIVMVAEALAGMVATVLPMLATVLAAIIPVIIEIIEIAVELVTQILGIIIPVITEIVNFITANMPIIQMVFEAVMGAILFVVMSVWPVIQGIIESAMTVIRDVINIFLSAVNGDWEAVWTGIAQLADDIWNGIREAINGVLDAIKSIIDAALQWISETFGVNLDAIQNVVDSAFSYIQSIVDTVMNVIQDIINVIMSAIQGDWEGAWNAILQLADDVWTGIGDIISTYIDLIQSIIDAALTFISDLWNTIWTDAANLCSDLWNQICDTVGIGKDNVIRFVGEIPGKVMGFFADAGSWLINAGKNVLDGFLSGLRSAWDGVVSFVSGIGDWIVSHKGPESYDKKMLVPAGQWIMGGLNDGLQRGFKDIRNTLEEFNKEFEAFSPVANVGVDTKWSTDLSNRNNLGTLGNAKNYLDELSNLTRADIYDALGELFQTNEQPVNLYLDGKLVASTLSPYTDQALQIQANRRGRF